MVKRRLPKLTEAQITQSIRYYLRARNIFHWKVHQGLGCLKGVPDILGVLPGGRSLMIEIKREGGKMSPDQALFLEAAHNLGACAFVARSVKDVEDGLGGVENLRGHPRVPPRGLMAGKAP